MICPICKKGTLIDYTKGDYLCDTCHEEFTEQDLQRLMQFPEPFPDYEEPIENQEYPYMDDLGSEEEA